MFQSKSLNPIPKLGGQFKLIKSEKSKPETDSLYETIGSQSPNSNYKLILNQFREKYGDIETNNVVKIWQFLRDAGISTFDGYDERTEVMLKAGGNFYIFNQHHLPFPEKYRSVIFSHYEDSQSAFTELIKSLFEMDEEWNKKKEIVEKMLRSIKNKLLEQSKKCSLTGVHLYRDAPFSYILLSKSEIKVYKVGICDFDSLYIPNITGIPTFLMPENDEYGNDYNAIYPPNSEQLKQQNEAQCLDYINNISQPFILAGLA